MVVLLVNMQFSREGLLLSVLNIGNATKAEPDLTRLITRVVEQL